MKWWECLGNLTALFCLTAIAIVAMLKLGDPENIVINVVVAIAAFVTGTGVGGYAAGRQGKRATDTNGKAANENGGGKAERTGS